MDFSHRDALEMRVRPRRLRHGERGRSALHLRRVSALVFGQARRQPSRFRPSVHLGAPGFALQRSIVKVSFVANRGATRWRAHGRYLAREGAQEPGRHGVGFDAEHEGLEIPARLGAWQADGDRRLWKLIVSPEHGERLDLRRHARELVALLEGDLGTRLEWIAIEHFDTAHPHIHVMIRGRDEAGRTLYLPRAILSKGIRERSQELATRSLGLRSDHDRRLSRERAVSARHVGVLDAVLEARINGRREVVFEDAIPASSALREQRLQLLRRLAFLRELGLAERTGKRTWTLSPSHRPALRQMQLARDLQKSLSRHGRPLVEPDAPQKFTRIAPGSELRGRVAGRAVDEATDETYLVLEGTDGAVHFVPENPDLERARSQGPLPVGHIVTLRGLSSVADGERTSRIDVLDHGRLEDLEALREPATILDLEAARAVRDDGEAPTPVPTRSGFFARFREAVRSRLSLLTERGLIRERSEEIPVGTRRQLVLAAAAEERIEMAIQERERRPLTLAQASRLGRKEVVRAAQEPGRVYRGRVVAMAEDDAGARYVVLDTGRHLTAVPTERAYERGQELRARSRTVASPAERRRVLAWQLDDLERERSRSHDRGR